VEVSQSWWAQGKESGERWHAERAEPAEVEALERLYLEDSGLGISTRCLFAAERIQSGELNEKWTTLLAWVTAERPAGRGFEEKYWLAGFVHGVLEPDAAIPTT
jgi:hypothetical protein